MRERRKGKCEREKENERERERERERAREKGDLAWDHADEPVLHLLATKPSHIPRLQHHTFTTPSFRTACACVYVRARVFECAGIRAYDMAH